MNSNDREIIDRLTLMSERELIETLSQVFDVFAQKFDAAGDVGDRYVLARSSFEKGEDTEPYIEFFGVPSKSYLSDPQDQAFENGGCPTCGVIVACVDKLATCPVCGTRDIECT